MYTLVTCNRKWPNILLVLKYVKSVNDLFPWYVIEICMVNVIFVKLAWCCSSRVTNDLSLQRLLDDNSVITLKLHTAHFSRRECRLCYQRHRFVCLSIKNTALMKIHQRILMDFSEWIGNDIRNNWLNSSDAQNHSLVPDLDFWVALTGRFTLRLDQNLDRLPFRL